MCACGQGGVYPTATDSEYLRIWNLLEEEVRAVARHTIGESFASTEESDGSITCKDGGWVPSSLVDMLKKDQGTRVALVKSLIDDMISPHDKAILFQIAFKAVGLPVDSDDPQITALHTLVIEFFQENAPRMLRLPFPDPCLSHATPVARGVRSVKLRPAKDLKSCGAPEANLREDQKKAGDALPPESFLQQSEECVDDSKCVNVFGGKTPKPNSKHPECDQQLIQFLPGEEGSTSTMKVKDICKITCLQCTTPQSLMQRESECVDDSKCVNVFGGKTPKPNSKHPECDQQLIQFLPGEEGSTSTMKVKDICKITCLQCTR
eukprot:GHVR01010154.1.p1 GENE.GHVR01010154.1~~GHVR01010154.1.p1  ORF type:complete len:321 (-),score=83.98 GHVR01010154.1:136-1098(-)